MVYGFAHDRRCLPQVEFLQKTQDDHMPLIRGQLMLQAVQDILEQQLVFQVQDWSMCILLVQNHFERRPALCIARLVDHPVIGCFI